MSANFQFTLSLKKVFKNLENETIISIKNGVNNAKEQIQDNLGTTLSNGGYSAYDELKKYYYGKNKTKDRHYNHWTIRDRGSKKSVSLEVRNRYKYSRALYTTKASTYHSGGFRSSTPHKTMYFNKEQTNVSYYKASTYTQKQANRSNQVSARKYATIQKDIKKILNKSIKKYVNIKSTSSYKG